MNCPTFQSLPVSPVCQHSWEQFQFCWASIVYSSPEPGIWKDSVKRIYRSLLVTQSLKHAHTHTHKHSHTSLSQVMQLATLSAAILLCLLICTVFISAVTETDRVQKIDKHECTLYQTCITDEDYCPVFYIYHSVLALEGPWSVCISRESSKGHKEPFYISIAYHVMLYLTSSINFEQQPQSIGHIICVQILDICGLSLPTGLLNVSYWSYNVGSIINVSTGLWDTLQVISQLVSVSTGKAITIAYKQQDLECDFF